MFPKKLDQTSQEGRRLLQSEKSLPQLKKRLKRAFKILVLIATAFLTTLFVGFLFSPIHEIGHALACRAFGVRIIKIEWTRISFATPADWRVELAIAYAGGLFAAFCLSITYMLVSRFTTRLSYRVTQRTNKFHSFAVVFKTAVLAILLTEFTNGIFEGTAGDSYVQIGRNYPIVIFAIIVILFFISLGIQIMRARKTAGLACMHGSR